jgi:succinate-acetate transporter protein
VTQIRIPETSTATPVTDPTVGSTQPVIADPGPLGLAAFAMTTFVLSVFNTRLLNISLEGVVLPLALAYGGGVQLLAGMWEFRKGNTFGALAFSSFGAFWLSFYWYVHSVAGTLPPAQAHKATGIFLLAWAIFTLYMTVAAMRTTGAVLAVFAALEITFIFLAIGAFATGQTGINITKIGGWFGFITAALAWYASFAGVTNSTWGRVVLPTYPLNAPIAGRRPATTTVR